MLWMTIMLPLPFLSFSLSGSSVHMDGGDVGGEGEAIAGDGCAALGCGETKRGYVRAMEGWGCMNDGKRDEDGEQRPQRKGGRMAGLNKSLY